MKWSVFAPITIIFKDKVQKWFKNDKTITNSIF